MSTSKLRTPQKRLIQHAERWTHEQIDELGLSELELPIPLDTTISANMLTREERAIRRLYKLLSDLSLTPSARSVLLNDLFYAMSPDWRNVTDEIYYDVYRNPEEESKPGLKLRFGKYQSTVFASQQVHQKRDSQNSCFTCTIPMTDDKHSSIQDFRWQCSPLLWAEMIALTLDFLDGRHARAFKVYHLQIVNGRFIWSEFNLTEAFVKAFRRAKVVQGGGAMSWKYVNADELVLLARNMENAVEDERRRARENKSKRKREEWQNEHTQQGDEEAQE